MLLHISSLENEILFSDWLESRNIFMDFMPFEEGASIKSGLARNRAMPNYDFVLFHFTKLPLPENEVEAAVAFIQTFHHARIIVFAPQSGETAMFFGRLCEMGLKELVQISDETDLMRELEECVSEDGKDFAYLSEVSALSLIEAAKTHIRPAFSIPDGFKLTVGVAGAQSRIGTTTQVFKIYHALKSLGFVPCVIEPEPFLEQLTALYPAESLIDGDALIINGIEFARDTKAVGYNAFVFDCGVTSPEIAPILKECTLRFLCAGAKPWEVPDLVRALTNHPQAQQHIIFSFVLGTGEAEALELLQGLLPASFAPWSPDIWAVSDTKWHEDFLVPFIKEALPQ